MVTAVPARDASASGGRFGAASTDAVLDVSAGSCAPPPQAAVIRTASAARTPTRRKTPRWRHLLESRSPSFVVLNLNRLLSLHHTNVWLSARLRYGAHA